MGKNREYQLDTAESLQEKFKERMALRARERKERPYTTTESNNTIPTSKKEELTYHVLDELACTENQTYHFIAQVLEDIKLFEQKHQDYGPANISEFGEYGVLVRSNDKMARLKNLNKRDRVMNESVDITWQDLSIYGVIARLIRAELWLKE